MPDTPRTGWRTPSHRRHTWRRLEAIRQDRAMARASPTRLFRRLCGGRAQLRAVRPWQPELGRGISQTCRPRCAGCEAMPMQLGVNPNEIVAMGESAGANLAALLGTYSTQTFRDRRVLGRRRSDCVVDADGSDEPLPPEPSCGPRGHANARGLARASSRRATSRLRPLDQVSPGDPPMLLIQGRQDPLIPVSQSRELQAASAANGVRNQLISGQRRTRPQLSAAISRPRRQGACFSEYRLA